MVSQRGLEVLRAIVQDYVSSREPVGSKAIVDRHQFGVSAATIRNDMALLREALGFGDLPASAWLLCCCWLPLRGAYEFSLRRSAGDTLRVESEVLSKRRSQSRPEMGMFKGRTTVFNQNDVAVMTMVSTGLIRVRNPEVASD